MTDDPKTQNGKNTAEKEDVRLGYQMAITMWNYYGQVLWSKYNAMLVANSIVLACISFIDSQLFKILLAIAGVLLCFAWNMIHARGNAYHNYFFWSAREIGENCFPNETKFHAQRGQSFSQGAEVTFKLADCCRVRRMNLSARLFSTEQISRGVIWIFGLIYFSFVVYTLWQKLRRDVGSENNLLYNTNCGARGRS